MPEPVRVDTPAGPGWLEQPTVGGRTERVVVRVLGRSLRVRVWSPGEGQMPLLLVHDGAEYAQQAGLIQWAGAMIEAEAVAPFRVALLPPGSRNEWYSASAAYGRALGRRVLPAFGDLVPVVGRPVGMGASLGALAMLHAQRAWPGTFAGLFLQSGSFFVPRFDRQESGFPRYGRIVRFVRGVLRATAYEDPVPVAMTCATDEENVHNNRAMAAALDRQGYDVRLAETGGRHDFPSWRDGLDPHLTRLLASVWPAR
ncbi:MAG TPA: alpha/beta hydrolase-fold protein [Solirubrobacteraceae bacterium]|nr:alpha/beta hydrolase-fold protein [Solirubrobacteraceae bacterium]